MSSLNTLLIGSGRLAYHLQHWSQLNRLKLLTWNRSESVDLLRKHLASSDIVWLAILDQSIISFFEDHLIHRNLKVVHFSGALYDSRLIGAHPLMSFPRELLKSEVYGQIHFAVDESVLNLPDFLPGFKNSFFKVPADKKAMYHALCVTAGNFPQLLWTLCLKEFRDLQVPEAAFELYVLQITKLFLAHKENSLTGPLVRGDFETIEKNISALSKNQSLLAVYKTFAGVYKNEK